MNAEQKVRPTKDIDANNLKKILVDAVAELENLGTDFDEAVFAQVSMNMWLMETKETPAK
jgi:hypothetical protein